MHFFFNQARPLVFVDTGGFDLDIKNLKEGQTLGDEGAFEGIVLLNGANFFGQGIVFEVCEVTPEEKLLEDYEILI